MNMQFHRDPDWQEQRVGWVAIPIAAVVAVAMSAFIIGIIDGVVRTYLFLVSP